MVNSKQRIINVKNGSKTVKSVVVTNKQTDNTLKGVNMEKLKMVLKAKGIINSEADIE